MTPEQAINAVNAIIDDITGRKGIGDEFDQIDDETLGEIKLEWLRLILEAAAPPPSRR